MRFRDTRRDPGLLQAPLDDQAVTNLCRHALGPEVGVIAQAPMPGGRFNTNHRVTLHDGRRVILRVAPRPGAPLFRHELALLRREAVVQHQLNAASPLTPRLLATDFSHRHIDRDYVVQDCLAGELWSDVAPRLPSADQHRLWRQLGEAVRAIHATPGTAYGRPLGPAYGRNSDWLAARAADLTADLHDAGIMLPGLKHFADLLEDGARLANAAEGPCLIHGDLWPRNLLVSDGPQGWHLSGILDGERAFWGEPGAEWIFAFLDLPEAFWRGYGRRFTTDRLDRAAWFRRHCDEIFGALQLILDGQRFGFDTEFARGDFAQSLAALERLSRDDRSGARRPLGAQWQTAS